MVHQLRGTVRRFFFLDGKWMLVLEDGYSGGVEPGEQVRVNLPSGAIVIRVENVAWGSAFDAQSPPLTLITDAPPDIEFVPGAEVVGV